jgi:hypothetical protein
MKQQISEKWPSTKFITKYKERIWPKDANYDPDITPTPNSWRARLRKRFQDKSGGFWQEKVKIFQDDGQWAATNYPAMTAKSLESFIEKELERALDLQRVQHSRTMAILIKDQKQALEKAYEKGKFDQVKMMVEKWVEIGKEIKLLAKKEK